MHGPIRLNFEPCPDFIGVLVTCKNEEDSIKIKELEYLYIGFSDGQGQLTP